MGETPFVGWSEPLNQLRPYVKWFDANAKTWRAPLGIAASGEIPLTTCGAGRPSLAPLETADGVMMVWNERCTTGNINVFTRELR